MTPGCVASQPGEEPLRWIPISSPSIAREVCGLPEEPSRPRSFIRGGVPKDRCDQIASPGEVFLPSLLTSLRLDGLYVNPTGRHVFVCLLVLLLLLALGKINGSGGTTRAGVGVVVGLQT